MARFWQFWKDENYSDEISATVPLATDISDVEYPSDNYKNFAKEGYGHSEVVHACIRELAVGVASPRYFARSADVSDGIVEAPNTPLGHLVDRPNPQTDFYQWLEQFVTHLYVSGNSYILKERDKANNISALWLLRPDRITIKPSDMGVHAYVYTIDSKEYEIPKDDIAHMAFPNPSGDVYGVSPLSVLSKVINLDMAMTDFAKLYFQNAGVPSGLLKIKRRINSQEEAATIRSRWRSTFGGSNNMHRVAVMDDDAEYQAVAQAPKDMGLQELHNLTESRICSVLGVPPIVISANVGLQRATYSNYREARFAFHSETLDPLVKRIVRFLNYCLAPDYNNQLLIDFDNSAVLDVMDNRDSLPAKATTLFTGGIISLNEAREMIGQQAIVGGDFTREISETEDAVSLPSGTAGTELRQNRSLLGQEQKETLQPKAQEPTERAMKLSRGLVEDREPEVERLSRECERHFNGLRDRVMGMIGRLMERGAFTEVVKDIKDLPLDPEEILPAAATMELANILYKSYSRVIRKTFDRINESGLAGTVEWSDKNPIVTGILTTTTTRADMIHHTTRKHLQKAIEISLARGYTIEQLARGVPADNFPGVQSLMGETEIRGKLIARTETMRSQNMTTTRIYRSQGFEYCRAVDIDGGAHDNFVDPADPYGYTCAQRNGQIYSSLDAENVMDHPNGTLSWIPLPTDYKPDDVL